MTPESLRYTIRLKLRAPAIATLTSPQTNATHATLVATTTIAVPDSVQHHRDPISGATIIIVLALTALPSAKPNSTTRNIFNSNNSSRSPSNFRLTINRLSSTRLQPRMNVSIQSALTKRPPLLQNPGSMTPHAQKQ